MQPRPAERQPSLAARGAAVRAAPVVVAAPPSASQALQRKLGNAGLSAMLAGHEQRVGRVAANPSGGPMVARSPAQALVVSSPSDATEREAEKAGHQVMAISPGPAAAPRVGRHEAGHQVRSSLSTPFGCMQPKLVVGQINDPLEHEADRVADQVIRMPAPAAPLATAPAQVSGTCVAGEVAGKLQKMSGPTAEAASREAPVSVHEVLRSPGEPLDASSRAYFEARFGQDFSRVRVHIGTLAEQSARDVDAHAYTVGQHIVFDAGRYRPGTHEGRRLLAHELTHVVQQSSDNGIGHTPRKRELVPERAGLIIVARAPKGSAPAVKVPPRGSVYMAFLKGGGFHYTFNGDDALSWKDRALKVFTYYLKDAFPGVTDEIAAHVAGKLQNLSLLNVTDESIRKYKIMEVDVPADVHKIVIRIMKRDYPQFKPTMPQTGNRTLGEAAERETATKKETAEAVQKTGDQGPALTPDEQKLASELADLMKGAKSKTKVDPNELVKLYKILKEAVKDPYFSETGESFVRFAKFFEINKDKIEGIIYSGPKGKFTQENIEKIINEYDKYIAAEPVETKAQEKLETVEDYEKEFKYDPGWQKLSKADRKLLLDFAKLKPEDIVDKKVDFTRVTRNMKVSMALKLSDKAILGEIGEAAEQAFTDPTFIITLVVMMGIYVGLWLTPDPSFITKIAAGTLTAVLLWQFAWEDIIGTAKSWFALEEDCDNATDVAQLREAGNKFLKKLGQTGFDVLMFIVMWRVGKKLGPKVQKIGAKRGVARAEAKLTEAEARPGSGKTPKASAATVSLLNEAKVTAVDPANPTAVLDALAKLIPSEAQNGLARLRSAAGDGGALKAVESTSARGLDLSRFLTEKGLPEEVVKSVKAEVQKAKVGLARAKLIEVETVKDPQLREAVRAEQYKALTEVLKDLGILNDPKVQSGIESRSLNVLISVLGEAIGRTKLGTKYPASKGYEVLSNLVVTEELKGFKSIADWRAAEKAKAAVNPGSEAALKLEKQLSRQAARLFEKDGKVYDAIGEIDAMVTEPVKGGKPRPVEVAEVKTGGTDKAAEAAQQIEKSAQGLGQIAADRPGVRLFERTAHNEIGKDLTNEFDLSKLSTLKKTTFGLEGKTGFSGTLGITEEGLLGLAESLIKSLPPKGPHPSLPPPAPKKEKEKETADK